MLTNTKRIFMNEADGGSGNSAPTVTAVPTEPSAAPKALDVDALMARLGGVIDEKLNAHQNAINAGLRKAGTFKQEKTEAPTVQPTTSAPIAAQAGLSLADVETLLERKGAVSSRAAKHGLSDAATKRFEAAMANVPRESLAAEADSYLADLGLAKVAQPVTAQAATEVAKPASAPSAPSGHGLPTQNGVVDLFSLTQEQLKNLGPAGVRQHLESLNKIGSQMAGIPQRPKPPAQR